MSTNQYPEKFKVYTASAGAGKTFRLTLEYLKIALRNPATKFRRILAITFTVKATNEMKARIIEACKAFSMANEQEMTGRNAALLEQLQKEVEWSREEIATKSHLLYRTILHNYGDFAVSTIDSFSQRIIRSFAYELGKPINFDIELDTAKTADYLTAQLLAKVGGEDKHFTELMVQFFEEKLNEDDSIYIEYDIQEAVKIMLADDSLEPISKLAELKSGQLLKIGQQINTNYYQLKQQLHSIGKEVLEQLENYHYSIDDFHYGSSGFMNVFYKLANGESPTLAKRFNDTIFQDGKFFKNNEQENPAFQQFVIERGQRIPDLYNQFTIVSELRKAFPRMAMLAELRRLFDAYQNEEEFILISEFNKIISEQVKGQPAPFLYEKVGERYEHILIDEFQDTSVMQWHNLVPLVVESLEKAEKNESLIVGDSKQAIYRWRGGETKQLTHLPKLLGSETDVNLQDSERTFSLYFKSEPMEYNFRSREQIVSFNNELYSFILQQDDLSAFHPIYNSYFQNAANKNSGGYVRIDQVERKAWGEEKEDYYQRVFSILEEQLNQIKSNDFEWNDVAILCRRNEDLQLIAQFLQVQNIAFTSKESLALMQEKAVAIFPTLVRLFTYPNNQIYQAEVVNFLIDYGIIKADRDLINQKIGHRKIKTVGVFAELINEYAPDLQLLEMNRAELLPLWEQFVSWLPSDLQNSAYISFFRDELWQFISINGNNTEAFLDWWTENHEKLFLKSSDTASGIQLLTIHKAKGLEFEVVVMPFVNWKFSIGADKRWVKTNAFPGNELEKAYLPLKKDLEQSHLASEIAESKKENYLDNLNLLYVATTRAVSELYMVVDDGTNNSGIANCSKMNQFMNEFINWGDASTIEFGQPVKAGKKEQEETNELQLQSRQMSFNQVSVAVNNRASVIWNDEIRGKIDFGSVVHSLLENITTEQDISPAVYQALAEGTITDSQQDEIRQMIEQVVHHNELNHYFTKTDTVFAEQGILTPEGNEFIPDRIVINETEKTVKILDFKTGGKSSAHQQQIIRYAELLEQMDYTVEEKKLVYLQNFEIVSV